MLKTEQEIERDFYSFIVNSELGRGIRGKVYREGMRPTNAKTEDLIIKFLSGLDTQIQTGVIILNLYVPDIVGANNSRVQDKIRTAELQALIRDFVTNNSNTEYLLETDGTPKSTRNEEIDQYLIYTRIKFNRLS